MLIERTLQEIGASLGLAELRFSEHNVAALRLGETDTLFFERQGDLVFMSLARPVPPHRTGIAQKAMNLCSPRRGLPVPVRAGMSREGDVVFTVRFTERDFSVTEASQRLNLLRSLQAVAGQ